MTTVDPELAPLVNVARATQIWRRSRLAVWLYVVVVVVLGAGSGLAPRRPVLFGVVTGAFAAAGFLRWQLMHRRPAPVDPDAAARWLDVYRIHCAAAGLLWGGFACYLQIAYAGAFLQFAVLLITAGIVCFAAGAFAGERRMTRTYMLCVLAPTIAGVAAGRNAEAISLCVMIAVFAFAIDTQVEDMDQWFVRSTVESLQLEKARKEAEAAARVKSEFLANMSHELRTPMNGVMGMLELLEQSPLDREQRLLVRTSRRSAESLLDIVNDILDFSKMSAGKLDFVRRDFPVRNAIEDVFDLLGIRAIERGLDLGYRVDPAVPEWLRGDEGRLRQVLMNLVSNAIKFSFEGEWPHGGGVFVEARLLSQQPGATRVEFSVTDQGQGMTPATVARLFRPFMQADTSTSRRFGGTGLGLAISRQLVEAMGGSIAAESEENAGSRFTFDIVLEPAAEPHTLTPLVAPCRALVIDPAPLSRATISHLLVRHGAAVTGASTVDEAERQLHGASFAFVVAGVDGRLARERLASILPDPPPPVIWLFNRGENQEPPFPGAAVLTRPVRTSQLAEAFVAVDRLPRADVPAPVQPPSRLSGNVLIVEDNAVNQLIAKRLVNALGLRAVIVDSGESALDSLAAGLFDLVLMDCQMPGLDGYETTRRLRQRDDSRHLPIIAMTANAMKGDRELCLAAGMDDYLSKPIRLDRLREILSRYLPAAGAVTAGDSSK